jgi:NAD+-dependent protein deacetylase sirtuin 5
MLREISFSSGLDLLNVKVYPAAGFAEEVAANGGKVAVFNLQNTPGDDDADFVFLGPCAETLPEALFGLKGQPRNEDAASAAS